MTDQELDRVRCAALFGLDESDLEEQPFDGHAYWYEGVPEWAADDFDRDERNSPSGRFRTLIIPCLDGKPQVPEGFRLVKLYRSAAECECPWCGPGTTALRLDLHTRPGRRPRVPRHDAMPNALGRQSHRVVA